MKIGEVYNRNETIEDGFWPCRIKLIEYRQDTDSYLCDILSEEYEANMGIERELILKYFTKETK